MVPNTLIELMTKAGIRQDVVAGAMQLDAQMQQWRRRMARRELGRKAIAALGLDIEMTELDTLAAIAPLPGEDGLPPEITVGTVAERLNIDPSRASRLVAEVVEAGYAMRVASQTDARKTLVVLTDAGQAIIDGVHGYKFLLMGSFLDTWSPAEVATFVDLFNRFSAWTEQSADHEMAHAEEIAALARRATATPPAAAAITAGRA